MGRTRTVCREIRKGPQRGDFGLYYVVLKSDIKKCKKKLFRDSAGLDKTEEGHILKIN